MTKNANKVDEYDQQIPVEIRQATEALGGANERAALVLLIKEDGLPFSELKEELQLHQQSLTNALNNLQDGALVACHEEIEADEYSTNYKATKFGKRLLDCLYGSLEMDRVVGRPKTNYDQIAGMENTREGDAREYYNVKWSGPSKKTELSVDDGETISGPRPSQESI